MAVTLTGSKYASASLASVGTTTVSVTTTPFSSGDFAVRRLVALFTSGGAFKGIGYVRRYVSTSSLQLEKPIFDPADGTEPAQVVGDILLVSKNATECVTAGWAKSGQVVTVTDTVAFGTSGNSTSLVFYDESLQINSNSIMTWEGGVVVFGKLDDYDNDLVSGGCSWYFTTAESTSILKTTSSAVNVCLYGGRIFGPNSPSYVGAYLGSTPNTLVINGVHTGFDLISPGAGATWGANRDRAQIVNCFSESASFNAILVRWGDGVIRGGRYKFKNNTADVISVFGATEPGTYAVTTPAGNRSIVLDAGAAGQNAMVRLGSGSPNITFNIQNIISTELRIVEGANPPVSTPNGTVNYYFRDSYTNLEEGSIAAAIRDSDWTSDDVETAGVDGVASPRVYWKQAGSGLSVGASRGPWTHRVRKYGYAGLEFAVDEEDYQLGTAGTAKNVSYGGAQIQVAIASLSGISEATADGYAGITVTDHGASPVTWQGKSFSITVTVDLATYPGRTATEVFAHIKSGIAKATTFNGKNGYLWHDLIVEFEGSIESRRGRSGGAGATLKGVRVVDQDGDAVPGITQMQADDGTYYVTPESVSGSVTLTQAGSRVQVYNVTKATELVNQIVAGTTLTLNTFTGVGEDWSAGDEIRIRATYQNGLSATAKATTTVFPGASEDWSATVVQVTCPVYDSYGIDGSTVTEFSWDSSNVQFDVNDPDNTWYVARLFAWDKYWTFTEVGIREAFEYISAVDVGNIQIDNSAALDNLKAVTAMQGDQIRLFRPNGTLPVVNPTTGGGGFTFYSTGTVFIAETGTSGLTPSESSTLSKLNGVLDANITEINSVPVTGAGTELDPWGP